jgi:hypothetical protein
VPITHFGFDSLPRVEPSDEPGSLDLVVPFRLDDEPLPDGSWGAPVEFTLLATVDGTPRATRAHAITPGFVEGLRRQMRDGGSFRFDDLPPYLDMCFGRGRTYVEGRVAGLRPGVHVTYRLEVRFGWESGQVVSSRTYSTYAVAPVFGGEDIRRTQLADVFRPDQGWVLMHRRENGFDHVRVDVTELKAPTTPGDGPGTTRGGLADLVVTVGDTTVDLCTAELTELPMVDTAADSVVVTVPATAVPQPVTVAYAGLPPVPVDVTSPAGVGEARIAFVNFAIQGLNDYFAVPNTRYDPPRTYTQTTLRDEQATFSSRPGSVENDVGDGYAFTLEAHRHYAVKQMWAMNGGLAIMMAHDTPDDLEKLRQDVSSGLVQAVVTGYGAHRLPYYSAATNTDAIHYGKTVLDATVGAHSDVYYPDSRVYARHDHVTEALDATGVQYLVLDAPGHKDDGSPVGNLDARDALPPMDAIDPATGRWLDYGYVWRDRATGIKVLFIDPQLKDLLLSADDETAERGKIPLSVRAKLLAMAAQPVVRRSNMLVYSDDADKASGNGWFDGDFAGGRALLNRNYQAALSWISRHPWVRSVTTEDLTDDDCVGTIDVHVACDPFISRWTTDTPAMIDYDFGMAFDTWYASWASMAVSWLGDDLATITRRVEHAIAAWPARNRMTELARLHLAMCLHESQWSKASRDNAGRRPEDFVVAETIQLRNTHVYLAAAVWADWAERAGGVPGHGAAYRDSGPVVERVAALERDLDTAHGVPAWRLPGGHGLQWDHDPLACVVLYNTELLVVIDRNGGAITHVVAMVDGRARSVSGSFKAYQSLLMDWETGAGTECDGIVIQNTVRTPNHAYVAGDVGVGGATYGQAPHGDSDLAWVYPNNFDAYDVVEAGGGTGDGPAPWVTLAYGDGTGETAPTTLAALDDMLAADRAARVAGKRGVVLHDTAAHGSFRKTVTLDGRSIRIAYSGVLPGHEVSNELCVDLWASAMGGLRQTRTVTPERAEVSNAGITVTVEPGPGAAFSAATLAGDTTTAEALELHRVLTDDLRIVCAGGGEFTYAIRI